MLYMAGCTIGLSGTREARPSSLVRIFPFRIRSIQDLLTVPGTVLCADRAAFPAGKWSRACESSMPDTQGVKIDMIS